MSVSLVYRYKQPAFIKESIGFDDDSGIEYTRTIANPNVGKWKTVTVKIEEGDTRAIHPGYDCKGVYGIRTNNGNPVELPSDYQNATAALIHFRNVEKEHRRATREAEEAGKPVRKVGRPAKSLRLLEALEEYTQAKDKDAKNRGKAESVSGDETAVVVKAFIAETKITHVKDVTAESIRTFTESLRGHQNTTRKKLKKLRAFMVAALSGDIAKYVRNQYDKPSNRDTFFKAANLKASELFEKTIKREKTPEVKFYHREEIAAMRKAFPEGSYERVAMELYLQTGFRAGEGTHLLWKNVNFRTNTMRTEDIEGKWTGKTGDHGRSVDVSDSLMRILKAWKQVCPSKTYVLGIGDDTDPQDYSTVRDRLQSAARKAGIEVKDGIDLKRFRSTHACECLWGGFDIYTVSARLGHSRMGENNAAALGTTIKYLLPNPYIQRTALNSVFGH